MGKIFWTKTEKIEVKSEQEVTEDNVYEYLAHMFKAEAWGQYGSHSLGYSITSALGTIGYEGKDVKRMLSEIGLKLTIKED